MEKLTVKEALEQGYTKVGTKTNDWQSLVDLEDIKDFDSRETTFYLADKKSNSPSTSVEDIKELLVEHISVNHSDETGDDTDDVYDLLNAIELSEFEPLVEKINKVLEAKTYHWLTDIQLIY